MFIPHSEKKVFHVKISIFTLSFIVALAAILMVGFFFLSTHFTSTSKRYAVAAEELQNSELLLEDIIDEISNLKISAKEFRNGLETLLSKLEPAEAKNFLASGTGGDLAPFIAQEDVEEFGLREISDLRQVNADLHNAVEPLWMIIKVLESQMELLVNIPTLWPLEGVRGRITQQFGPAVHPFSGGYYMHKGIDIAWGYNVPIVATADGKVVKVDRDDMGLGLHAEIQHKYSFSTRYGHFHKIIVQAGQMVERGEVIGYMGNTGLSNGPHLHYEVKIGGEVVDPLHFLNIRSPIIRKDTNQKWNYE